jgi:hypothetical protein
MNVLPRASGPAHSSVKSHKYVVKDTTSGSLLRKVYMIDTFSHTAFVIFYDDTLRSWYSNLFVRIPLVVIYFQVYNAKAVGTWFKLYKVYNLYAE